LRGVSKDGSRQYAKWFETRIRQRKSAAGHAPHHEGVGCAALNDMDTSS
jgi:hypothetical protein